MTLVEILRDEGLPRGDWLPRRMIERNPPGASVLVPTELNPWSKA